MLEMPDETDDIDIFKVTEENIQTVQKNLSQKCERKHFEQNFWVYNTSIH